MDLVVFPTTESSVVLFCKNRLFYYLHHHNGFFFKFLLNDYYRNSLQGRQLTELDLLAKTDYFI